MKAWKRDEREIDYLGERNVWKWSDQASNPADLWEEPLGNKTRRSATPPRFMTGFMTRQPLSDPWRHTTVTFHKSWDPSPSTLIKQFISVFHTLATTFNITVLDTSIANIFLFSYIYRIVHQIIIKSTIYQHFLFFCWLLFLVIVKLVEYATIGGKLKEKTGKLLLFIIFQDQWQFSSILLVLYFCL